MAGEFVPAARDDGSGPGPRLDGVQQDDRIRVFQQGQQGHSQRASLLHMDQRAVVPFLKTVGKLHAYAVIPHERVAHAQHEHGIGVPLHGAAPEFFRIFLGFHGKCGGKAVIHPGI